MEAHEAVTPAGRSDAAPMPVALVVTCVMAGIGVLMHTVGAEEATPAVFTVVTVMVPVAEALPQPPVSGML